MIYALFDPVHQHVIGFTSEITPEIQQSTLYKSIPEECSNLQQWRWEGHMATGGMVPLQTPLTHTPVESMKGKVISFDSLGLKDPSLSFKYIDGFGDFMAWFLHSKYIGWLTHWITGRKSPCSGCSKRKSALNVLIPFPIWKRFFKTREDKQESLRKAYKDLSIIYNGHQ